MRKSDLGDSVATGCSAAVSAIELSCTHTQEIRVDGELWGYAIWVGRWYVVYRWDSEWEGSLESPKTADTLEDIKRVVQERIGEDDE
jgi:hypothetical protein